MKGRVLVTEKETASLIRASAEHGPVRLQFGPGWVGFQPVDMPWAYELLQEWRGETFRDGAGI